MMKKRVTAILLTLIFVLNVFTIIPVVSASAETDSTHLHTWDEPTWEWNVDENDASATAVFTCSTCGETLRKPADSVDLETEFIDCRYPSKTYYASVALSGEEGSGSYSDYHTVDLEPHHTQLRHLDFTIPTPEQNGSIDCWYCAACHTYLEEEDGEYREIPEEECILPYLRYEVNDSGAKVVQYLGKDSKVTVPEFVPATYPETYLRGRRVTSIELMPYDYFNENTDSTFHSAIYLKEIDCPYIERIEDNAFEGEYMLEKFSTGSALNYIGSHAFPPESIKEFSSDSEQITIADDAFEGYGGYGYSNSAVLIGKHTSGLCEVADKYDYLTFEASDSHIYTDEPTWEWNGFDSAEASFGCTAHDHTETITAEITSEVTTPATLDHEGVRTYTATVSFNGKTYRDAKTESIPVSAEVKHSLTVDEAKIGVNFYIPDGAVISDSAEIVTKVIDGVSYNRVQLRVPAAEMTKELTVTYTVNGEEKTDAYSVAQYADTILNSSYPEDLKDLIKAMLNYGAQAQLEFERSTDKLANDGIDYAPAPINVEDISFDIPNKDAINSNLVPACNISYYGFSLLLQSDTALRFYFKKEAADIVTDEIHIKVNNEPVEVMDYNSRYVYIEIKNILADKLDTPYALTVNGIAIGTYSALSYIKDTLMNYSDDEQLCNTVSSLYDYHLKAKSYFG